MRSPHLRTARSGAGLRILRAAVFAAVCVVLGTGGHVLVSHAVVPLWTLVAAFFGTALVAACLAGRERSLAGIAALLAVGQTVLHTLFGLGQHGSAMAQGVPVAAGVPGGYGLPGGTSSDASVVAQAARLLCGASTATLTSGKAHQILTVAGLDGPGGHVRAAVGAPSGASMSWTDLLPSLPMALVHVLAAVAAGWVLRRGDLALLRIVRLSAHGAQEIAEVTLARTLRAALALVRLLHSGRPAGPRTVRRRTGGAFDEVPPPPTAALQHTVIRRGPPAAALALAA